MNGKCKIATSLRFLLPETGDEAISLSGGPFIPCAAILTGLCCASTVSCQCSKLQSLVVTLATDGLGFLIGESHCFLARTFTNYAQIYGGLGSNSPQDRQVCPISELRMDSCRAILRDTFDQIRFPVVQFSNFCLVTPRNFPHCTQSATVTGESSTHLEDSGICSLSVAGLEIAMDATELGDLNKLPTLGF